MREFCRLRAEFPPLLSVDGASPVPLFGKGEICGFYLFGGVQFFVDRLYQRNARRVERDVPTLKVQGRVLLVVLFYFQTYGDTLFMLC